MMMSMALEKMWLTEEPSLESATAQTLTLKFLHAKKVSKSKVTKQQQASLNWMHCQLTVRLRPDWSSKRTTEATGFLFYMKWFLIALHPTLMISQMDFSPSPLVSILNCLLSLIHLHPSHSSQCWRVLRRRRRRANHACDAAAPAALSFQMFCQRLSP